MITRHSPPARSELVALLAELRALDVDPPADAERAVWLAGEVERLAAPPDVSGWVADADLHNLSGEDLMTTLRRSVVQLRLADPAGRGLLRETVDALTARATVALAADCDRLLDGLEPRWDAAAGIVHEAARTGLRGHHSAADAVQFGDEAVTAWRPLAPTVATLDRLYRLWAELLNLSGRPSGESSPSWLDASIDGPVRFRSQEVAHA